MSTENPIDTSGTKTQDVPRSPAADPVTVGDGAEQDSTTKSTPDASPDEGKEPAKADSKPKDDAKSGEDEGDDGDSTPRKRRGGYQRTIDRLLDQNERLAQENAALRRGEKVPAETSKSNGKGPTAAEDVPPKPVQSDYASFEEFNEALIDWKADRKLEQLNQDRAQQRQRAAAEERTKALAAKMREAAKDYPDYKEVIAEAGEYTLTGAMRGFLEESEKGGHLLYVLAQNLDEARRISQLSPVAQIRELDRMEQKLTAAPPRKNETKAPAPAPTVKGRSTGGDKDPADMNDAEYRKWRESGGGGSSG